MDNTTSSSESGATPVSDQPATGAPASTGATPEKPTTTVASEETTARIAELERALKNATEERDRHRKKLSSYEEAERKAAEEKLSEIEREKKARAESDSRAEQYRQQLVTASVKLAAKDKGIINPDLAALAIQQELEYDEYGMPNNVEKALEKLVKNNPYLVAQQSQPSEPQAPAPPLQGRAPTVPAMNPGRSQIAAPGSTAPGRIPRLSDPGVLVPPGTVSKYQP